MNRLILPCALLIGAFALPACSDNQSASPTDGEDKQWMLGGEQDTGNAPTDMSGPVDASPDDASMTPRVDMNTIPDEGFGGPDFSPPPPDFGEADFGNEEDFGEPDLSEPDFGEPDFGEPDMQDPDMGSMEGEGCGNSNECSSGLVCCADFSGQFSCTAENSCFTGGICEISDDCPGMQECCDLSQLGVQQNVCRDRCRMMGGGGVTGCMNNSECTDANEVCCPSFQGAAMCTPSAQCQTGGSCALDTDCLNGQLCCDFFGQAALCLDQCPF